MSEYFVTKTWNPGKGYSCCFRNWKAAGHCSAIHGYDLIFATTFACEPEALTKEGWVVDFGGLDPIKRAIENTFDHKMLVASDDPYKDEIMALGQFGVADIVELPAIGMEMFSGWLARISADHLYDIGRLGIVTIKHAVVYEHQANQGGFRP